IDNPWQNRLGPVVKAYYAQEETRRQCTAVLRYEQELVGINAQIARLQEAIQADAAFVAAGNALGDGLNRRAVLNEKRERLTRDEKTLMGVISSWPGIQQVIDNKELELSRLAETLEAVQAE